MAGQYVTTLVVVLLLAAGLVFAAKEAVVRAYTNAGHSNGGALAGAGLAGILRVPVYTFRLAAWLAVAAFDARHGAATFAWRRHWRRATAIEPAAHALSGRVTLADGTPAGAVLHVAMPPGWTSDDLDADRVASALGAQAATVSATPAGPGFATVSVRTVELLAAIVPLPPMDDGTDLEAIPVGIDEHGHPWTLALTGRLAHLLAAGVTGSGKGSVLWNLARGVAPRIAKGTVELRGLDPKGGMELGLGRDLFAEYADRVPDIVDLLEQTADEMDARAHALAGTARTFTPTTATPLVVVMLDEVANVTAYYPDAAVRRRAAMALSKLCTQGRAPGFTVCAFLQDPRKEVLAIRNLFPTRVALRLDEAVQVAMILGDGARSRGAVADRIPDELPGVGYVARDGGRRVVRVRAAHVDDAEVVRLAATYPASRSRTPAGEALRASSPPTRTRGADHAAAVPVVLGPDGAPLVTRETRAAASARRKAEHAATRRGPA